jgi:hypothetical protein
MLHDAPDRNQHATKILKRTDEGCFRILKDILRKSIAIGSFLEMRSKGSETAVSEAVSSGEKVVEDGKWL